MRHNLENFPSWSYELEEVSAGVYRIELFQHKIMRFSATNENIDNLLVMAVKEASESIKNIESRIPKGTGEVFEKGDSEGV